jgi:elongation factor Ts
MMDCKKALVANNGDLEEATMFLQKKGMAGAAKKAGRTAAEGLVNHFTSDDNKSAVLLEINCETDFVARNDAFKTFVKEAGTLALATGAKSIDDLKAATRADGQSVEDWTKAAISSIGENIQLRRLVRIDSPEGVVGAYIHAGSQIGVLVDVQSTDSSESAKEFSRNVAMHVAATNPQVVRPEDIDQTVAAKQKEIFIGQSIEMGKPPEIAEKIVVGRMRKWQSEVSLIKQAYVKEPDMTVEKYSAQVGGVKINSFVRYQVGEGIEKVTSDLAAEVAAQLGQ